MIKLYQIQGRNPRMSGQYMYDPDEAQIRSDDAVTEGYFVTAEKLRECFVAGQKYQLETDWDVGTTFDDWLKKELGEE